MVKNQSHTLAYSLIALQEMNLAYKYPIIFWNCACLISDAGGNETEEIDEEAIEENKQEEPYYEEMEEFGEDDQEDSSYDEDDSESGFPATIVVTKDGKKKKKIKATNYGKVATAIGRFTAAGIKISAPDINDSQFTFSPDVDNNMIRYGLSGITRIGEDLVKSIIEHRPYTGIEDFLNKIKLTKPQMINLIKAGAFDRFGDRYQLMKEYVISISDCKKRITLQNMKMLIDFGLIPNEYDMVRRIFNYNKYLKSHKIDDTYFGLDNIAFNFYEQHCDLDILEPAETESGFKIRQTAWKKIYDGYMDQIRPFVKSNAAALLQQVNDRLIADTWNKKCDGSISKWEMSALSCYIHDHELSGLNLSSYGIDEFNTLSETPEIDRYIPIKGKMIPIFKLHRIAGTVLDRDKAKKTVTLLTTHGVVTVKIYGVFAEYDKQISERDGNGKKHVLRKSEFTRGNLIIVTGIRDGEHEFRAKTYKNTPFHHVETITDIKDGEIVINNRND